MAKKHNITWAEIDEAAVALGASYHNRAKWRNRCIPAKWKLDIAQYYERQGKPIDLGSFPA